ncbi:hypothetical protein DFH08DRAFT_819588 [Mycena albidolilacea]|uniref:Uncharacterized protein n=1 Tax=Mycena albidolilacea TaxID=1033008 RepID=A0AAD6ZE37_9AGAR|nr:hypothetical protein DFH08DRAFT_819588 [Mycena albidolilacea]
MAHPTSQSFTLSRLPLSFSRLRLSLGLAAQPVKSLGCSHDSFLAIMSQDHPHCWSVSRDQMKPDEGPYLPTSRACAHVRPHPVPAVVLSPLRAALDRSCPSSPHLRLLSPPPAASHLRLLLLVLTQIISPLPFPSVYGSAPLELSFARALPRLHLRPRAPAHCVCRAAIGKGRGGGGVWDPLPALGLLSAGENVHRREEEGREYLRQVSGEYGTVWRAPDEADVEADAEPVDESVVCKAESECGWADQDTAQALWLEKGTRRATHARTGGAASSAQGLLLPLPRSCGGSDAGARAFPDGRSKRRARKTKRRERTPCAEQQGARDAHADAHARHGVERDWAHRLFGSESAGPGPASRGDGAALADRDVGVGVGDGRGRGRGESTGTGARADSVSSAGGTRSSGGLAKGRREIVGSEKESQCQRAPSLLIHAKSSVPRSCLDCSSIVIVRSHPVPLVLEPARRPWRKHDATRGREKTNERKTKRRQGRTYPIRAASRHASTTFVTVLVPICVKRVSAPRIMHSSTKKRDCDERTWRAIRVKGRARDSELGVARAAPAGPTKCSLVRRLRWNEEGDVHKSRNVNGQRRVFWTWLRAVICRKQRKKSR